VGDFGKFPVLFDFFESSFCVDFFFFFLAIEEKNLCFWYLSGLLRAAKVVQRMKGNFSMR
jgi:hypothetical protein